MPNSSALRIAVPEPASPQFIEDAIAYNQRSLPQYLHALYSAGATPIPVPLHETPERVAKILATCQGVLLPGSGADIDPAKYGEQRLPECGDADRARAAIDEMLIKDAFQLHKPILAICHGTQALNVYCGGRLFQDIPTQIANALDHAPGRSVLEAHALEVTPGTRLAAMVPPAAAPDPADLKSPEAFRLPHPHATEIAHHDQAGDLWVNSSHHQSIRQAGNKLLVAAISPVDGVIEAVELDSEAHWVVAVQWHPERTYNESAFSRNLFAAFVQAARATTSRKIEDPVLQA